MVVVDKKSANFGENPSSAIRHLKMVRSQWIYGESGWRIWHVWTNSKHDLPYQITPAHLTLSTVAPFQLAYSHEKRQSLRIKSHITYHEQNNCSFSLVWLAPHMKMSELQIKRFCGYSSWFSGGTITWTAQVICRRTSFVLKDKVSKTPTRRTDISFPVCQSNV